MYYHSILTDLLAHLSLANLIAITTITMHTTINIADTQYAKILEPLLLARSLFFDDFNATASLE